MLEIIEKALTIMLLATAVKFGKMICLNETMVKKLSKYKYIPKYISGTTIDI